MSALKTMPISFPGLFGDWEWNPNPVALHIGHGVYWYGIILACAMLIGLWFCMRQAPKFGLTADLTLDMILWAVPTCILGSRCYYVIFYLDLYRRADGGIDWGRVLAIWDGGLAMYGTVIVGILVAYVFTRYQKLPFLAMTDLCVLGLLLGQSIGRWANLINREAFGAETTLPWRMRLWISSEKYIEVHPTFFYESLWNIIGFCILYLLVTRRRRFEGENTCFYFFWYGLGRFMIEGLRSDSLYLFNWQFMGQPVRVSQALSLILCLTGSGILFYNLLVQKRNPAKLFVNRNAAPLEETDSEIISDREIKKITNSHTDIDTDIYPGSNTETENKQEEDYKNGEYTGREKTGGGD